jgi:anti-sigma factor RsiW
MADRHWSDDEIVARLYDVGPQDGHIEACPQCQMRLEELQLRRKSLRANDAELSAEFMALQRQAVYKRLEPTPLLSRLRPAPLAAALLLAFVIMTVFKPAPPRLPEEVTQDTGIFEDVFEIATSTEPSAVEPVRSLFEVQQ